jgi:hypothetical protein
VRNLEAGAVVWPSFQPSDSVSTVPSPGFGQALFGDRAKNGLMHGDNTVPNSLQAMTVSGTKFMIRDHRDPQQGMANG